jgi:hypothetical protein
MRTRLLTQHQSGDQIKKNEMRGHVTGMGEKKCVEGCGGEI